MSDYFKAAMACDTLSGKHLAFNQDSLLKSMLDISKQNPRVREADWHPADAKLEQMREDQRQRMAQEQSVLRQTEDAEAEQTRREREERQRDEDRKRKIAESMALIEQGVPLSSQKSPTSPKESEKDPKEDILRSPMDDLPKSKEHYIDKLHKSVAHYLMLDQDEMYRLNPYPHMEDLDNFLDAEKCMWRDHYQAECERELEEQKRKHELFMSAKFQ